MRLRCLFTGRVQGVGFRATARHVAVQYPITGWVRNDPDGSVSLEAQGSPEAVRGFLAELQTAMGRYIGSSSSSELPDLPSETGFEIRR
jgi:acylphosphatase